jgi:hypothetical protein
MERRPLPSLHDFVHDGVLSTLLAAVRFASAGGTVCRGRQYKKIQVSGFPVPSRDVTYLTLPGREKLNYSWPGRV